MKKIKISLFLIVISLISSHITLNAKNSQFKRISLGEDTASVIIYEFASLSCVHCARFNSEVISLINENYVKKGLVKIIFIDVPFGSDANLFAHSLLYQTKDTEQFIKLLDTLFANQQIWMSDSNPQQAVSRYARLVGLSNESIDKAKEDINLQNWLKEDSMALLKQLNIQGTPSLVIAKKGSPISFSSNKKLEGYQSYDEIKAVINEFIE